MDDYNIVSLQESNNEWVSRLINILSPCVIQGVRTMLSESLRICMENDEQEKYLMTFQNILSRVPKWSSETLEKEVENIKELSKCEYLEDLISCVHIVQLKALTCIRVGQKQKSIDIDIPKFDVFVHKVYIHLARKLFSNVYLFELNVTPLTIQKNNREIELITKDCILEAVRESIPVESILRAYLDKTIEETVEQEIVHENVEVEVEEKAAEDKDTNASASTNTSTSASASDNSKEEPTVVTTPPASVLSTPVVPTPNPPVSLSLPRPENIEIQTTSFSEPPQTIKFSDKDEHQSAETGAVSIQEAPKDVVSLERRAEENYQKQLAMEQNDDYDDDDDEELDRIQIHRNENVILDVETL